jgi:hypothetical protein
MARKLYYKVVDNGRNAIGEEEWESILRLQHWNNSEFQWTAGRLGLKMFAVFPNPDAEEGSRNSLLVRITLRRTELRAEGLSENAIIEKLAAEGLIMAQKGGYFDNCIASGFTRVASNEFNAYLVCEFLLKASLIAPGAAFDVYDEGEFVKSKQVLIRKGAVELKIRDTSRAVYYKTLVEHRHVFAVVDPAKYDNLPGYQSMVSGFNEMPEDERLSILKDWNWLGFDDNFDLHGDDVQGFDLNRKVSSFSISE